MAAARYRTYLAIGYVESLEENWIQILEDEHVPILISPLHDQDENEDGSPKKAHYHIMLDYSGPHPESDALKIWKKIGAVPYPGHVADKRAMCRYFCHLDNSEKKKYDISQVIEISGFDYLTIINLPTDKYSAIGEMMDFVKQYNILSFAQLMIYARDNKDTWYRSLCDSSAFIMREFIKSYFWEQRELTKNN